jgi:hypothetical protein
MEIVTLRSDADFINSIVPDGYLLVFAALDDKGNVIKRYKDSSGNFGDIGGSADLGDGSDLVDTLTKIANNAESDKYEIAAAVIKVHELSNHLDEIIGDSNDTPSVTLPRPVFYSELAEKQDISNTGQVAETSGSINYTEYAGVHCAYFNGNSYIYYSDTSNIPTGTSDRTISAYVCPTSASSDRYVMSIGQANVNTRYGFGFYENNSIGVWAKSNTVYYEYPYDNNVWYHVVVTFSNNTEKVYVNGTLIGTNTRSNINTGVGGVCIGAGIADWVDKFTGYIANVRVYDCVLTDDQITLLDTTIRGE